jgi:hypothetical protein
LGEDQQYVEWSGNDVLEQIPGATFNVAYDSTFWGVVNSLGNLGAGGSGSALFSATNQVVGSASLSDLPAGPNTAGTCPVPSVTPSPQHRHRVVHGLVRRLDLDGRSNQFHRQQDAAIGVGPWEYGSDAGLWLRDGAHHPDCEQHIRQQR